MKKVISFFILASVFLFIAGCSDAPPKNSLEAQAEKGKLVFQTHCVGCHGEDGKGINLADVNTQPADLTKIVARRGGGDFPVMEIARVIDGRDRIEAHGTTTMPIWGEVFSSGELLNEDQVQGKLGEIIAYLKSMQTS